MLSRFYLIPESYGRTDGRTDGQSDRIAISISRVSVLTCDKNRVCNIPVGCIALKELATHSLSLQRDREKFIKP